MKLHLPRKTCQRDYAWMCARVCKARSYTGFFMLVMNTGLLTHTFVVQLAPRSNLARPLH